MRWVVFIGIWFNSAAIGFLAYHLHWTNQRITKLQRQIWDLENRERDRLFDERRKRDVR